jgi:excisionase family DNA binding protein
MDRLLSLEEMAAILNRSPKTLRRHVNAESIPHTRLGKRLLFDAAEVLSYLKHRAEPPKAVTPKHKVRLPQGKFAGRIGL